MQRHTRLSRRASPSDHRRAATSLEAQRRAARDHKLWAARSARTATSPASHSHAASPAFHSPNHGHSPTSMSVNAHGWERGLTRALMIVRDFKDNRRHASIHDSEFEIGDDGDNVAILLRDLDDGESKNVHVERVAGKWVLDLIKFRGRSARKTKEDVQRAFAIVRAMGMYGGGYTHLSVLKENPDWNDSEYVAVLHAGKHAVHAARQAEYFRPAVKRGRDDTYVESLQSARKYHKNTREGAFAY